MSKLDLDKPVQTVSGIPVTLLKRDAKGSFPLIGVLEDEDDQAPQTWSAKGEYMHDRAYSEMDLVNVPPRTMKRKVFLVFMKTGDVYRYYDKPLSGVTSVFGIKEIEVTVTEGENLP